MSSFVLSLVSPVLHKMICGNFKESICKRISLDDIEGERFLKLVRLACGEEGIVAQSLDELLDIGALAQRLQMDSVRNVLESVIMKGLREGTCVELSHVSETNGLEYLRKECYKMLRDEFRAVSYQEGFDRLSEETMGNLLEENELAVEREEDVFEALVRWMKGSGELEGYRGEGLLTKIRYGVIDDEYLENTMLSALPGHKMLKNLVSEALTKKQNAEMDVAWDGVDRLCEKWLVARRITGLVFGSDVLKAPNYVAIDPQGHLVVSDNKLRQVIVFDLDGSVVRRIGSEGEATGPFDQPSGVAVDQQSRIVVANCWNGQIQVLNADGSLARTFGSIGHAVGRLKCPKGLAIDANGHIVVADFGNHRIQVFDVDGSYVRHFGAQGAAVGQFKYPMGVAVDGWGRIVVADHSNHRVQVFNVDGAVSLCFGSEGDRPGQLKCPCGVAVDREGRFIVADGGNNRVQVFNFDGTVARVIDAAKSDVGRLRCPRGVVVDGTGRIVVVEGCDGCKDSRVRIL